MLLVVGCQHSCCYRFIKQLVGPCCTEFQFLLDEVDDVAALECHGGILEAERNLPYHLVALIIAPDFELLLAVAGAVQGDGILVEFENEVAAVLMAAHGMADDEDAAALLHVEDVAALLEQHGAQRQGTGLAEVKSTSRQPIISGLPAR